MSDELTAPEDAGAKSSLIKNLVLYTLARLALFAVLAGAIFYVPRLIDVNVPLLVAMAFGLLLSLPISMFAFKSLRLAVNADIATVDAKRREQREDLESKLRGDRE
ncbi:DUF4229 domain-containing protein [Tomitella biformata]|uniref:DUF4229 domain-containing protein n=1 Tax=Tomitella biformata TaxID=630403 RepID=UPI0004B02541|nr:DUF4229 domain-containing protein [Tomitella biformata]